jgi:hypothetical protein
VKCLTWNLEWKEPRSRAGRLIADCIAEIDPDVACYTEVVRSIVPDGHTIEADPDYGYPNGGDRRKVILWSKYPWTDVDAKGDGEMPSGRFVSGTTGGIRFVGVCIPWRDAHVRTGRRDRKPWDDHVSYCRGLGRFLAVFAGQETPTCVLGDYNQRIPRVSQPLIVASALADAMPVNFRIVTQGIKDSHGMSLIDHLAVSPGIAVNMLQVVPRVSNDGTELSDHVGVAASLERSEAS